MEYKIRESTRAKNVSIVVDLDGSVEVVKPHAMSLSAVQKFVEEKRNWILKSVKYFKNYKYPRDFDFTKVRRFTKRDYIKHKESARTLIHERVKYFNQFYNFPIKRIAIKNQRSCWGSCSEKGNLNFNYRLIFLPDDLRDYIVVHEICHLGELNHSPRFWRLVEKTVPRYKELRKELKKQELFYS